MLTPDLPLKIIGGFRLDKLARFFRNSPDMKTSIPPVLITFALVCFPLVQNTGAVSPDGGYPGGNTAEGENALLRLTSSPTPSPTVPPSAGKYNTAVGFFSLRTMTYGAFNTGVGAATLLANTADQNTATGAGALLSNTGGFSNTANGAFALFNNAEGSRNTAIGDSALFRSTDGSDNTAIGFQALYNNRPFNPPPSGQSNTATGAGALFNNAIGSFNTAFGAGAGANVTTANNVICIGANVTGADVDNSCFIGGIYGQTVAGTAVFIDFNGQLGTMTSSVRFKDDIKLMDKASEVLFALKPVTFRYKKEIDPQGIPQFGLVAEEVDKVNPDLIVRDKEGKPYSVRYDQVNAMLLNEFLKEHRKVDQLTKDFEFKIAEQEKQIEALAEGLQKVSGQLSASKPAPQVVNNNQ
jgi:hypothetical protein